MNGGTAVACVLMTSCVVINGFALYALLQVQRRNRLPRSEKSLLFAVTLCGVGTGLFCNLPTFFISEGDVNKAPPAFCEALGLLGSIFMSASSWFGALLSFNRYFIITRSHRNRPPASKWRLVGVQLAVWCSVITVYVTMYLLVESHVGVPEFGKGTSATTTPQVADSFLIDPASPPVDSTNISLLPLVDTGQFVHVGFMVIDIRSGIQCSPHWRLLLNYLIAACVLFYLLPLCVVIMSYFLITRIAYRQIRNIRRVTVRSSDESRMSANNNGVAPSDGDDRPKISTVSGASEMVQGYTKPLVHFRKMLRESTFRRNNRVRRRKATIVFIIAISLFIFSWTPYYVYFLIESVSYQRHLSSSSDQWKPPFSFAASMFMTCSVIIGRTWSILLIAMLNRPYRRTMRDILRRAKLHVTNCCHKMSGSSRVETLNDTVFSISHLSRPTFVTFFKNNAYHHDDSPDGGDAPRGSVSSNRLSLPGQVTTRHRLSGETPGLSRRPRVISENEDTEVEYHEGNSHVDRHKLSIVPQDWL